MPWLCTTIAGSMPIFCASCSAAPSARGPGGTGSVNDVCTIPSPVVSPYGRTIPSGSVRRPDSAPRSAPRSFLAAMLPRLSSGIDALQQLEGRVVRAGRERHHAVQALAAVRRPLGDAEGAVGDRLDEALTVIGDPAEQVDRLAQDRVGAPVDEAALRRGEVLDQSTGGVEH